MATTEEIIIKVKGDISELEKDLANLKAQMASIQNTPIAPVVTPTVNTTNVTSTFTSLKDTIKGKFDEITGGIASQLGQIGTSARAAFTTMRAAGVSTFRAIAGAIASTGIGALVVAVGLIAANWDKIRGLIDGVSSAQRGLNELTKKNLETAKQKNELLNDQENILRLQGKSEKEILQSKIRQTKEVENATLAQIEQAKITLKAQLEAEERNQRILTGILNFISTPIQLLLKAIDSIGAKFGQNFNLLGQFSEFKDTLLFNPKEVQDNGEKTIRQLEAQYNKLLNQRAGYVLDINKIDNKEKDNQIKNSKEAAAKALKIKNDLEKAKNEDEFKSAQERQKVLDEIENANYKNEFDRERQQIRDEFFLKIETNKELEAELIKLREARIAEVNKKEKEANAKVFEEKYLNELKIAEKSSTAKALILKTELANGQISEEQYNKKIKDLEESTLQSKILIAGKWSSTVKKAEEDITTFTNQQADKRLDKTIENNKKNEELLKQAVNELLDFAQNGILITIGLNPNDVQRVRVSLEELKKTLDNSESTPAERAAAAAQAAGAAYQTVSNSIFAADTQRRQEELAALQGQQEEELRLAGDNEQKKEIIRQKYALKERELKRKQAEADKRKAIFDATVGTAVAVIQAAPNPILMAITAALGAAQIALIAATPIPKFAKGGAVPSSDIQGMINGRPHASGGVLIEAEGNEFITRKSQAMKVENLGLLEAINMSDSERDAYISRHYVMPALQAKESQAANNYRHSVIEAENNLIARVSSSTLKSIDRRLVETNNSIKTLAKKDYSW